jgi:hypothetical protein
MALCLYMDVHVQKPITIALQLRGVDDLELLAKACDPPDLANRVEYLPLR